MRTAPVSEGRSCRDERRDVSAFPHRRNSERLRSDMKVAEDALPLTDPVLAVVIVANADAKNDVALLDRSYLNLDGVLDDASETDPACCRVTLNRWVDYVHAGAMNLGNVVRHLDPPCSGTLTPQRIHRSLSVEDA